MLPASNKIGVPSAESVIGPDDPVLITGATGFIGQAVVQNLLHRGFRNLRCFVRPTSETADIERLLGAFRDAANIELLRGNLLSREDCLNAAREVAVIYHLATGGSSKSFPDSYLNSVVTTRNLLEACKHNVRFRRFVNVSSFAVYTNSEKPNPRLLDEQCPVETRPELRAEPYCFAKVKQDEIVAEYGKEFGIPFVFVRPGYVYGPSRASITGRVGIDTFGIFLHLGGSNTLPLTYIDNCADAIVLAGLRPGVDGEVFNIVDDDLPSSRRFLRLYKRNVKRFRSVYLPHLLSYALCYLWEKYSSWSNGQIEPVFNRRRWYAYWKKTDYSNAKLKSRLGWIQRVDTEQALRRYLEGCRNGGRSD